MAVIRWYQKKYIIIPILTIILVFLLFHSLCTPGEKVESAVTKTKTEIGVLRSLVDEVHQKVQHHAKSYINSSSIEDSILHYIKKSSGPKLFLITPTYARYTQQADLVRLSNTLKLVSNLQWIVIEDSEIKTELVSNLLQESGLEYTHLNVRTNGNLRMAEDDLRWMKHRGVDQRNYALQWIRRMINPNRKGVVYFADDDNTYHVKLFEEMRSTSLVSIWPVALVGKVRYEGPVCRNGKVLKFFTGWKPERKFPIDMAGFAINLSLLFKYKKVFINPDAQRGSLETDFLEQLHVTKEMLEAKASDCKKILVWHTQTVEPNMKNEKRLQTRGQGSDESVII